MARPGRVELPTLCLEGRRSIHLSYGRTERNLLYFLLDGNPTERGCASSVASFGTLLAGLTVRSESTKACRTQDGIAQIRLGDDHETTYPDNEHAGIPPGLVKADNPSTPAVEHPGTARRTGLAQSPPRADGGGPGTGLFV